MLSYMHGRICNTNWPTLRVSAAVQVDRHRAVYRTYRDDRGYCLFGAKRKTAPTTQPQTQASATQSLDR